MKPCTRYMKRVRCVCDIDHMYALRIENTSERDPHSYEATKAVAKQLTLDLLTTRLHSSVGRASHWYRGGHGFVSRWSLRIFSGPSLQLLVAS